MLLLILLLGLFFQHKVSIAQNKIKKKELKKQEQSQLSAWDSLVYFRFPIIIQTDSTITFFPKVNIWTIDSLSSFLVDSIGDANRNKMFYDSLRAKANKNVLTKNIYKWLIRKDDTIPKKNLRIKSHQYFEPYQGMVIRKISIKQLNVFGPTVTDTTETEKTKFESTANLFHTTTSEKYLRKNILFKVGDEVDPRLMAENEKIIRDLSFIHDVNFVIKPVEDQPGWVDVHIITKDLFSLGFNFSVKNEQAGTFEIYNRNTWGRGHTVSGSFVFNIEKNPSLGGEVFYGKRNLNGSFIDLSTRYSNTWQKHTATLSISKDFLTSETKSAGGIYLDRSFRFNRVYDYYPLRIDSSLNYSIYNFWLGRNVLINQYRNRSKNFYISGGYYHVNFFTPYNTISNLNQNLFDRNIYLGSVTLANQKFFKTNLVYRYGITEDIPYGYKYELVFGYEDGEFDNRLYGHLHLATGSVFKDNNSYFSASFKTGGYLNHGNFEQGLIQGNINYFSPFRTILKHKFRNFVEFEYTLGINRFKGELLTLNSIPYGIRGFTSKDVTGIQRLTANIESVMFLRRDIYRFKIAAYAFTDLGIIGNDKEVIFNQDFFAAFGTGLRIRNESLVFNTLEIRIAYHPDPPIDMSHWSFKFATHIDKIFSTFNGQKPKPILFQ